MSKESDKTKLYSRRNKETNMGVCVCLRNKALKGTPKKDVVSLCIGKCGKKGIPKNQIVMTADEASELGVALIGTRWLELKRSHDLGDKT